MKATQEQLNQQLKDQAEHQRVLLSISELLKFEHGRVFIKYLFENFSVGEMPALGLKDEVLMEMLGYHRAGNSIFKIVAQADPFKAAQLLAQIEKDKYEELLQDSRSGE